MIDFNLTIEPAKREKMIRQICSAMIGIAKNSPDTLWGDRDSTACDELASTLEMLCVEPELVTDFFEMEHSDYNFKAWTNDCVKNERS